MNAFAPHPTARHLSKTFRSTITLIIITTTIIILLLLLLSTATPVLFSFQTIFKFHSLCYLHSYFHHFSILVQFIFMQNPLRRPNGNPPLPRDRDVERNENGDAGYLAKDVRAHLVAMSGEFVGTFMFLYFAFAATQIASTSIIEAHYFFLLNQTSALISCLDICDECSILTTDSTSSIRYDRSHWTSRT